ncbi:unnamed protein product (macronuclear) [Paramecium tetraurelia]|uniref:Tetratricopeptide repeat protein n=1 Tax=Paramecium tetraurelia TaxID=5888 RepID=A0E4T3_PARTE|nr:uncharacterized protein GSPATT00023475001 [Paramecium tetraurelia]CAK90300.1 unnamed protein product [Paramecium tetraurelia]|eukprot:XP_001457697.1 hypothetical protein (macronuclear) [Paramecium tetraurelia strain d4-2]
MQELKSPKLLNNLVSNVQKKQNPIPPSTDINILQQILDQVQPVEIIHNNDDEANQKKNNKFLKINEGQAEEQLIDFIHLGIQDFEANQYSQCVYHLKQAEQILTAISYSNPLIHYFLMIRINLGVVFYAIGWLEQAFTCFEDAILALKKTPRTDQEGYLLSITRLHCYLQCCIILSESGQHSEALAFAKMAIRKASKILIDLQKYLKSQIHQQVLEEILKKSLPILKPKHQTLVQGYQMQTQATQESYDSVYSGCPQAYIHRANILFFIQMNPVNLNNFKHVDDFPTNQQYLHMICLFVISLYCTSTESKFVQKVESFCFSEAENYLSRALEIAYLYLPKDLPLINQLLNVHNRFYDISKQAIDEDAKMKMDQGHFEIVLLKPVIESQKCGFVIPIIRKSKYVGMKSRTRSMKEQQFSNTKQVNFNVEPEHQIYEAQSKTHKRKLRSISTTNKYKPNSPKWANHQLAEVYLNQQYPFKSVQIKKQQQKYNNKTVDLGSGKNSGNQNSKLNRSENQIKKKQLNIQLMITNNINQTSSTQNSNNNGQQTQVNNVTQQQLFKRKRNNQSFNFDQITTKSPVNLFVQKQRDDKTLSTIQQKIKSVIKQC